MTCRVLACVVALLLCCGMSDVTWAQKQKGGAAFHGIDVSHHQGSIDWNTVASDKRVGFVYIRASNGSRPDNNYKSNIKAARQQGLLVGSYHFLNPNCPVQTQFNNFNQRVKRGEQDLIPVVDIEDVPELGVLWKPQQARDFLAEFVQLVQRYYGVKPMIYTSNKFFTDYLGRAFADFPLFIARYGPVEPNPMNGARWTLWQFTRQGRVDGINHHVDLSRFNRGFGLGNIRMPGAKRAKSHSTKDHANEKEKKGKKAKESGKTKADESKRAKASENKPKRTDKNNKRTSKEKSRSAKHSEPDNSKNANRTSSKNKRTSVSPSTTPKPKAKSMKSAKKPAPAAPTTSEKKSSKKKTPKHHGNGNSKRK